MSEDVVERKPSAWYSPAPQMRDARSAHKRIAGGSAAVLRTQPSQPIERARRQLRWTMARTVVPQALHGRFIAFERGLTIAARLADKLAVVGGPAADPVAAHCFGVRDMVGLAHRALDAGVVDQGLAVLASVGMLLGGAPRAAFETALGLLRLDRRADACERLREAVAGMNDTEGIVSALLAQLWSDAGDRRWVDVARRVMATATHREARTRCMALLAADGRR